jgi:hypothetical protein
MLTEAQQKDREDFIQGLRDLADWYEASTEVKAPWYLSASIYMDDKEEARAVAKSSQGGIDKIYMDGDLTLRKEFGDVVRFSARADRKTVCTAKVVGTEEVEVPDYSVPTPTKKEVREVIEWQCDPLLK